MNSVEHSDGLMTDARWHLGTSIPRPLQMERIVHLVLYPVILEKRPYWQDVPPTVPKREEPLRRLEIDALHVSR
jgi:hypothetical protein